MGVRQPRAGYPRRHRRRRQITVRQGLTGATLRETVRHETVHSVLTPRNPALASRTIAAYERSHLWRYAEEALAEGYGPAASPMA